MGVDIETHHCRIGTFRQGCGTNVCTIEVLVNLTQPFKSIGSVIFIGTLLIMAGIESNPGPKEEEEAMPSVEEYLKDPLLANWVSSNMAFNYTNKAMRPFAVNEIKRLHQTILSALPDGATCTSCIVDTADICPLKICSHIKSEIKNHHWFRNPSFGNTNIKSWCTDSWEIAKCYMPKGNDYKNSSAEDVDFSTTINVIINCRHFQSFGTCDPKLTEDKYFKGRKFRNDVVHSRSTKVSDNEMKTNLDILIDILKEISTPTIQDDVDHAIREINKIKDNEIILTTEDVLREKKQALENQGFTPEMTQALITEMVKKGKRSIDEHVQQRILDIQREKEQVSPRNLEPNKEIMLCVDRIETKRKKEMEEVYRKLEEFKRLLSSKNEEMNEMSSKIEAMSSEIMGFKCSTLEFDVILPKKEVSSCMHQIGLQPKMDAECHNLSVRLDIVMDIIGASEDMRRKYWDTAMLSEILHTVGQVVNESASASFYNFGSTCEGTTTRGLNSDVDILLCYEEMPVVERIADAPRDGTSFLMVTDANTKPGYVKLQTVLRGVPQTTAERRSISSEEMIDLNGRICKTHGFFQSAELETERNGPAETVTEIGHYQKDYVNAYRCQKVPRIGNNWLHRKRPCGWQSMKQLQTIKSYGCFVVGVAHPKSFNKDIEWRISFSLQERTLMSSLNIYQHKCYILLKIIKNDIIQPKAGKSISSYHCKTCLFYTIENSPEIVWTRETLIQGTRMCLELLLRWVQKGHCPNYFIPDENMFDRLSGGTLEKVESELEDILKSGVGFLFDLKCDRIGEMLNRIKYISEHDIVKVIDAFDKKNDTSPFMSTTYSLYQRRTQLLKSLSNCNGPKKCLSKAMSLLHYLQDTDRITEHTTRDVRMALDALIPHVHLQMAQCVVSLMLTNRGTHEPHVISRAFLQHFLSSFTCDLISSRLILATYCLQSEMLDVGEEILLACVTSLKPHYVSMCPCHEYELTSTRDLGNEIAALNLSFEGFRSQCTTGCIVILPSQAKLVHQALRYEMYRSLYIERGPRSKLLYAWYEWIVVDSQVYMCFLLYILYSNTDRPALKEDSINKLRNVISADPNLGHRETAFNLLGWIYTQENRVPEAWRCFCRSLRLRPLHNAARWHLAVMVNEQIN